MGAALFRTFVTVREKEHLAVLTDAIRTTDPQVAQRIGQIAGSLATQISDPVQRSAQAVSIIARELANQAYVQAYNDAFLAIALVAVSALALLSIHLALESIQTRRSDRAALTA